jgi:hypothetical protein
MFVEKVMSELYPYKFTHLVNGITCQHKGCLSHHSHPCEGCGRIGGRFPYDDEERIDTCIDEIHRLKRLLKKAKNPCNDCEHDIYCPSHINGKKENCGLFERWKNYGYN